MHGLIGDLGLPVMFCLLWTSYFWNSRPWQCQ